MKYLIILAFAALFALFILAVYVGFRICAIRGKHTSYDPSNIPEEHNLYPFKDVLKKARADLDTFDFEEIYMPSSDGLKLYARYYKCEGSRKVKILMHGYRSSAENDFCLSVPFYLSLGFNVLTPHQRAHGKSEGRYITYGAKEKFDCRDWINEVIKRYGKDMRISIGGISMGASTVLMASGLELPENVFAVTADSGYTSGYYIVKNTAKNMISVLPPFYVDLINFFCRIFADFDLKEANTLNAMQASSLPTMFIHGTRDTFVPCEMTLRNYATCRAEKELFTVAGAEHGISWLIETEKYENLLREFFKKHS